MFEIPKIEMPTSSNKGIKVRSFTVAEVKAMSDADLLKVLSGEDSTEGILPAPTQQLISAELLSRGLAKASKSHWSIVPSFWLLIVSVIFSIIAIALPFYISPSSMSSVQKTIKEPSIIPTMKAPAKPVQPTQNHTQNDKVDHANDYEGSN